MNPILIFFYFVCLLLCCQCAEDNLAVYVVSRDIGDVGSGKYFRDYREPRRIYFDDGKDRVIQKIDSGVGYSLALTKDGQLFGIGSNYYFQISRRKVFGFHQWTLCDRAPKKTSQFQVYRFHVAAVDADTDDIYVWSSKSLDANVAVYRFAKSSLVAEERKKGFRIKEIALCSNRLNILYCPPKKDSSDSCSIYFYFVLIEDHAHRFVGPRKSEYNLGSSRIEKLLATDSSTIVYQEDKTFHLILYPTYTSYVIRGRNNITVEMFDAGAEKSFVYIFQKFENETGPSLLMIKDSDLGRTTREYVTYFLDDYIRSIRCNSHGMVALNFESSNQIEIFGNNEYAFFSESGDREVGFLNRSKISIPVKSGDRISTVSPGKFHFMVLTEKNEVYSVGLNVSGVMGTASSENKKIWNPQSPFEMPIKSNSAKIRKIVGNDQTTVILFEDRKTVIAIGANMKSQLCSDHIALHSRDIGNDLRKSTKLSSSELEIQDISIGKDFLMYIVNGSVYHCGVLPFEVHYLDYEWNEGASWDRVSCGDFHCVLVTSTRKAFALIPGMNLGIFLVDVKDLSSIANRTILLQENNQLAYMTSVSRFPDEREGSVYLLIPPDLSRNEDFVKVDAGGEFSLLLTNRGRLFQVAFTHGSIPMKPEQVVVSKPEQKILSFSTSGNLALIAYEENRIQSIDYKYPSIYKDDHLDRWNFVLGNKKSVLRHIYELFGSRSAVARVLEYDQFPDNQRNSLNFVIDGSCDRVFTSGDRFIMLCRKPPVVKKLDKETMSRDLNFMIITGMFLGVLLVYVSCCAFYICGKEMLHIYNQELLESLDILSQ